jgi:hypothetical protein
MARAPSLGRLIVLVIVLLVAEYAIVLATGDFTECDRTDCGPAWPAIQAIWFVLWGVFAVLVILAAFRWFRARRGHAS